jgi:membrane fusion protein (multidrug efflux system)
VNHRRLLLPLGIVLAAGLVLAVGLFMVVRAGAHTNKVALDAAPKTVTVVQPKETTYRGSRSYVGTIEPWVQATVGPQFVSAYVDTVLVRPGATVKKGDVLATLDCRNASATSQAVAMQAQALEARQQAITHEATRVQGLLEGGFVSPNEAEQKAAESSRQEAELLAAKAKVLGTSLEVNDCVLRAPFAGEVATRTADPGAFARPGSSIVSVVDRSMLRITADVPEVDFDAIVPGTPVHVEVLATRRNLVANIARRAPAADPTTRTVHFELDVEDPARDLPVGTTANLNISVGREEPAAEVPLFAAAVRGDKATLFVVIDGVAHKRVLAVKGEREGKLYLDPALKADVPVVTEGRELLNDNDHVTAKVEGSATPVQGTASAGGERMPQ